MNQFKKQIIGVITATAFVFLAMIVFRLIASVYAARFGQFAQQAIQLAMSKHFGNVAIILLVSMIGFLGIGFAKDKLIKPLYIVWGILACAACFAFCMRTGIYGKYGLNSATPEIMAMAVPALRVLAFACGIAFPLLHMILCLQACGSSTKGNIINQGMVSVAFLLIFSILTYIIGIILSRINLEITIAACLSAVIMIFPAYNMDTIRRQVTNRIHQGNGATAD